MKFRHLLCGTILAAVILASAPATAFAASPMGRFEQVNTTAISGWAYSSDSPDSPLNVMITVTNENTGEEVFSRKVSADEYREKLYEENKGDGCHGFTVDMDWSAYPDGAYLVEGGVGDKNFSNPKTYTITNGQAKTAPGMTAASGMTAEDSKAAAPGMTAEDSKAAAPGMTAEDSKAAPAGKNMIDLGIFETTAYCPCRSCSGGWGRHTFTGAVATAGHTIAVDPRVIPFGSKVMVNGVVYTAEDCGGAVKGSHIDIFVNTYKEARQHGVQSAEVYLVQS